MWSLQFLVLSFSVIFDHIGISSGIPPKTRDFLTNFGKSHESANHQESSSICFSDDDPMPSVPRCIPSRSTNKSLPLDRLSSPGELPLSTTPPSGMHRPVTIFGNRIEELGRIRLIPHGNPHRTFDVRKYTFPVDKPIQLRGAGANNFLPMPTERRHVLMTSTGNVIAILDRNCLRGIYDFSGKRAGMNIKSGAVFELTQDLIDETPLSTNNPISEHFLLAK